MIVLCIRDARTPVHINSKRGSTLMPRPARQEYRTKTRSNPSEIMRVFFLAAGRLALDSFGDMLRDCGHCKRSDKLRTSTLKSVALLTVVLLGSTQAYS